MDQTVARERLRHLRRLILCAWVGAIAVVQLSALVKDSHQIRLQFTEGTDLEAVPSADGRRIALSLWGGIWIVDARGGAARPITDPASPPDEHWSPRWSPDGRFIVFSSLRSDGGLFVVSADGGAARRLTDREFDLWPSWSPDGESIAFTRRSGGIWAVPAAGGLPRPLTPPDLQAQHLAWSPDGQWIAFTSGGRLSIMKSDGSSTRAMTQGPSDHVPSWTSDGAELLFLSYQSGSLQVWRLPVAGGEARQVTNESEVYRHAPRWLADQNRVLYTARGAIRLIALDGQSRRTLSFRAAVRLTRERYHQRPATIPQPGTRLAMQGLSRPAVAPTGAMVVAAGGDLWSVDSAGRAEQLTSGPADDQDPAWSSSFDRIAFVSNREGDYQLWLLDPRNRATVRLSRESGHCEAPLWHPSGSSIVFVHSPRPLSRGALKVISVADGSVRTLVETKGLDVRPVGWTSGDGDLLYAELEADAQNNLRTNLKRASLSGSPPSVAVALPGQADFVALAPRADLVAYVSSGELWAQSLGANGAAHRLSMGPAFFPAWESRNRIIFSSGGRLRRVDLESLKEEHLAVPMTWEVPRASRSLLLKNVRLLAPEPRAGMWDILIRGERIASVTRSRDDATAGGSGQVLDLNGRTLMPGLMDLHGHMYRGFPAEGSLYWGVTSVAGAGEEGHWIVQQQQAINSGHREGPRIFPAGGFVVPSSMNAFPQFLRVANQDSLERYIDHLASLGATQVKSYLRRDPWLEAATTRAAHRRGLPVLSHFLRPAAVASGVDRKEHAFFYARDGSAGLRFRQDVIEVLRKARIAVTPTLVFAFVQTEQGKRRAETVLSQRDVAGFLSPSVLAFLKAQATRPRAAGQSPDFEGMLEAGNANVAAARAAGIRLVAGTDYSSLGFLALHWELELLVAAGLTPAEAIAAATRNAALTLGIADDLGSVRAGALADLVVLDGDPLEDIRNTQRIYMVVKQGRIVDREALLRSSLQER